MNDEVTYMWRDVLGNPYSRNPSPEMLKESGHLIAQRCGIKGGSKRTEAINTVLVSYDRTFVISWLASRFMKKFVEQGCDYRDLQSLFSQAWKQAKEEYKKGSK